MTATVEEKIEAALFARVEVARVAVGLPVAWPNKSYTPDGAAYVEVRLLPNRNVRRFLKGSDPHFRQGILQLTVRVPLNTGGTVATRNAGLLAEQFPADLALYEDGIKLQVQAAPDMASAFANDSSWDVVVSVRYETFA